MFNFKHVFIHTNGQSINHWKALETVELITELAEKEQEFIKAAEIIKKSYAQAVEDQQIESILAEYAGAD